MKKSLVAILCVTAMVLAVPFASYAREASDTTIIVNSDSTDIYSDSVRRVYVKDFTSLGAYDSIDGWNTTGTYTFDKNQGMIFNNSTANAILNSKQFDGKYTVKYSLLNKFETLATVYFNYTDSRNYYSLDVDAYDGLVTLKKVVNSTSTILGTKIIDALVAPASGLAFDFEVSVDNGDNISAWYVLNGERVSIFENVAVSGNKLTSGKIGVAFNFNHGKASAKAINVYKIPEEDISNVSNTIEGKIVCYKDADVGSAQLAVAFYDDGKLEDVFTKKVNLTKGFNDFSIDIKSEKNLVGKEMKYFLFDNLSNIRPLAATGDVSSYRNEGFSDDLEPYYPMASAASKTVDQMYSISTSAAVEANMLESEKADRRAVLEMYKNAGFDPTADTGSYLGSQVLRGHAPQTYSTLTPKPLMGTYDQAYSIDAPWNNPIPKDNPRTEITTWTDLGVSLQISAVRPKGATEGSGLGMPIIIADENDGFERFAYKYSTNDWTTIRGALVRVPENYADLLNNISLGDRHAIFIDDTTKLGFQTWHTIPSNTPRGYDWVNGLVRDFDARSGSNTSFIDLTGMGNEAHTGVNAAGVPMDALTIKPADLKDNGEDIKHALGAAFNAVMKSRVYPAYDMDYGIANNETAVGCVPYGGITQLDPSLDLEGMYANGKLSLLGYKFLKAWRDYGLMNIDQIDNELNRGGMMVYSSATSDDWKDSSNTKYNVPSANGSQGLKAVQQEILAVLRGDSFFGLNAPVKVYVTTPVVKKTSYDADGNGQITYDDVSFVNEHIGKVITFDNIDCDINIDGEITERDADLIKRYLGGNNPQTPNEYAITTKYAYATGWAGNVRVTGATKTVENKTGNSSQASSLTHYVREGDYYSVSAIPGNGFVFAGWENEELAGETSNVINVKATKDAYYSAKFVQAPKITVMLEKNEDGEGTVAFTSSAAKTGFSTKAYGVLSNVKNANYQCTFKATPAEGYVFESWEVIADGVTKTTHSNILNAYINSDTTIRVNFKKANAYDTFDSLDRTVWTPVVANGSVNFPNPSLTTIYASVSNGTFNFANSNLNKISEYVVVNDSALSLGNITYITTVKTQNKENSNKGRVVFGYKDKNNYWAVQFSGKTDEAELVQKVDGRFITHAVYTPDDMSTLNFSADAEIHITTTSNGNVTVYIYQGEEAYVLAENFNAGGVITGKMGYGTAYASHITFDNFAVIAN